MVAIRDTGIAEHVRRGYWPRPTPTNNERLQAWLAKYNRHRTADGNSFFTSRFKPAPPKE